VSATVLRWAWRGKSDGEPMTRIRVEHYATRQDLVDLLCAHANVGTGTKLSRAATLNAIRDALASAPAREPVEFWAETSYSPAEAEQRVDWATTLVARLST
jgi:hypothetical protein